MLDGVYYDVAVNAPWLDWIAHLNAFNGIIFDHGFIPLHRINVIGPLNEQGETKLGDNVVPLRRPS